MPAITPPEAGPVLVVGYGAYGRALARSLAGRGWDVRVADDAEGARRAAGEDGFSVVEGGAALEGVAAVCPAPGVPPHHPLLAAARVPVVSELDLVADWTSTPLVAVTGTDGKTTVTTLVAAMLEGAGRRVVLCGNNELPLVTAVDENPADVYVVEVSSFRLHGTDRFAPAVATWLNLSADHLEWHRTMEAYRAAKALIWAHQDAEGVAIGNTADPVVMAELERAPGRRMTFGPGGDLRIEGRHLVGPDGPIVAVDDLPRRLPHDLANASAAAATAMAAGADHGAVAAVLRSFEGLPHRVATVGEAGGVRYVDDAKSTTPNATAAAVNAFESVVLIAGGRNKDLDLSVLGDLSDRVRAVVAIGDDAPAIEAAFAGRRPVERAASMDDAVQKATALAQPGDTVLLSPACTSFDWYGSYAERGDDFIRAVNDHVLRGSPA